MADAISPQALSDLIGSIYDCSLDPSRWEQALANVLDALDSHGLILGLVDLRRHRFLLNGVIGTEPYEIEQLSSHLPEMHALLGEALASWPSLDEPYVASHRLNRAYIEASPYFQQCVKAAGIVDVMHLSLMHTPIHHAGLSVRRDER